MFVGFIVYSWILKYRNWPIDLSFFRRKPFKVDFIDNSKLEFTPAILYCLDDASFREWIKLNYSNIKRKSDCLQHEDHRLRKYHNNMFFVDIVLLTLTNLARITRWHLHTADCWQQTADYCFVSLGFFYLSAFQRKPCTFLCKKRMGSSRRRNPELAMDFYISPLWNSSKRLRATGVEVTDYFPAPSWHRLEHRVELLCRPIPGKFLHFLEGCCRILSFSRPVNA